MPKPKTTRTTSSNRSRTARGVALVGVIDTAPGPEAIATRAYELFVQRGGSHGRDWEDWLAAERELAVGVPLGHESVD